MRPLLIIPVLLMLGGCGASPIVDASARIADARDCAAERLTVVSIGGRYGVSGCGDPSLYACVGDACSAEEGDASSGDERIAAARVGLGAIEARALECVGGGPLTLQVDFDADGQPQGLRTDPAVDGTQRACIGNLVLAEVVAAPGSGGLLVSQTFGGAGASDATDPPSVVGPDPGADGATGGGEATEAQASEAQASDEQAPDASVPAQIQAVMREHQSAIRDCYESQLQRDPELEGRVDIHFSADPSGAVTGAEVRSTTLENEAVESCLTAEIQTWTFPSSEEGHEVNLPFVFRPTS